MKLPSEYLAEGWCQSTFARDRLGNEVSSYDEGAVAWCMVGAIHKAFEDGDAMPTKDEYLSILQGILPNGGIPRWNDDPKRTQAEVVAMAQQVSRKLGLLDNERRINRNPLSSALNRKAI